MQERLRVSIQVQPVICNPPTCFNVHSAAAFYNVGCKRLCTPGMGMNLITGNTTPSFGHSRIIDEHQVKTVLLQQ